MAITINYKLLEEAGFDTNQSTAITHTITNLYNQQQDEACKKQEVLLQREIKLLEKDVHHKIHVSESRLEKVIKDFEIRIIREFHDLKADVKLIKGIGGFIVGAATVIGIIFSPLQYLHA